MKRRHFIKTSSGAVLAASSLINLGWSPAPGKLDKIGIQLYSVRDLMKNDFKGTITKVAEIGYHEVEFAGYYDRNPKDIRTLLDNLGLTAPGSHLGYDLLKDENIQKTIETCKILGNTYLILPSLPRERAPRRQPPQRRAEPTFTAENVKKFIDIFNHVG